MVVHLVPRGALAALAGATLAVLASSAPSSAFTLNAPSLAEPVATANVEQVWWHGGWGYGHPYRPWGWRRWGWGPRPYWGPRPVWGPPAYGFYRGPVRRCWVGPWGGVHCRWV